MFLRQLPDDSFKTIVQENGYIILLGSNPSFLEAKAKAISQYSVTAYPGTKIAECKATKLVKTVTDGYGYGITLNTILPPLVENVIQLSSKSSFASMNCHGSAVVIAGVFPAVTSDRFYPVSRGMTEISLAQLSAGDIIRLDTSHSFVFIDHDICLSVNGRHQPLRFYKTGDVLEFYKYPKDALKNTSKGLSVFRKNKDCVFSETIISNLINYYYITTNILFQYPEDIGYKMLAKVVAALYDECITKNKDNTVLTALYGIISSRIPVDLTKSIKANGLEAQSYVQENAICKVAR